MFAKVLIRKYFAVVTHQFLSTACRDAFARGFLLLGDPCLVFPVAHYFWWE